MRSLARNKKVFLPQSTAGLISYYEEKHAQLKIKPEHLLIGSVVFGVAVLLLRFIAGM